MFEYLIKVVFCIRRKEGISREEFHRYWLEEHGPFAKSLVKSLGGVRYLQSHTGDDDLVPAFTEPRGEMQEVYDGITEIWWESRENMLAGFKLQNEGMEAALEDKKEVIDFSRSTIFLTKEHEIF